MCPCVAPLLHKFSLGVAKIHFQWHNVDYLLLPLGVVLFVAPLHIQALQPLLQCLNVRFGLDEK
jgi:hypothetical protein